MFDHLFWCLTTCFGVAASVVSDLKFFHIKCAISWEILFYDQLYIPTCAHAWAGLCMFKGEMVRFSNYAIFIFAFLLNLESVLKGKNLLL